MPEFEPEKKTTPAEAGKRKAEPDKKSGAGVSASTPVSRHSEGKDQAAPAKRAKKPPFTRSGKWAIVLLCVLCVVLQAALFMTAVLPRIIERDVNRLLQKMAEGGGAEFRIKSITLNSAEVACKLTDQTRDGVPRSVGAIGSLSIHFSPLPLLLNQTIESIDIENCDITADYTEDGSISVPAYDIFAKSFQSGEEKKKDESAPADDLNAVIPVKVGRISLSGGLSAEARNEDAVDILHIPYNVTVEPDPEQGWNKLECELMIRFAVNSVLCRATYLHREKKVELSLDDFHLATSALPGTVRSALPRGLRAGASMHAMAEIDLNNLSTEDIGNSSLDLAGELTLRYRTPEGLHIDSATPFSLKTVPRIIPTVKPMNPPKTENDIVFTLGALNGEYDSIPFELGGFEVAISLRRRTLRGGFRFTLAESEPAEFTFGGGSDEDGWSFQFGLTNKPLLKAEYMGMFVSCRPDRITAELGRAFGEMDAEASFSIREFQAGIDGEAIDPELKGLTASLKPEEISGQLSMIGSQAEASLEICGGELRADYKGTSVSCRPDEFTASLMRDDDGLAAEASFSLQDFLAEVKGGSFDPELKSMTATFRPELISGEFDLDSSQWEASLDIKDGDLSAKYKDMTASFKQKSLNAFFRAVGEERLVGAGFRGGELTFGKDGMNVSFTPEFFKAEITMSDGVDEVSAELKGGKLLAEFEGMTCEADTLVFDARSQDGQTYKADAKITEFQFKQTAAGLTYDAPELGLNAAYDGAVVSGEAVCEDSRLAMPELNLLAQNLHWEFPFDYTLAEEEDAESATVENEPGESRTTQAEPPAAPRTGKVSLGDFEVNGIQAASFDGTIQWDDAAKALRLKTDANLLSINGQIYADVVLGADGVETACGITIPDQDADLSKDLARFLPQFEEISCTGRLGGSAVYKLLPKTTTGRAVFHISDADVFIPEQKLEVRGIDLGFEVPEIAILKSAPGQTLSFKSVKYDRIETGAGYATFRMEAPDTWQVENALLNWCNGHIRLGGITYRAGQTKTEAVLYCDRLELPLFLTQIGLGQINGRGSINGTIPVVLVQKTDALGRPKIDNIYFEDAFLFSTPGEDGVIKGDLDEALMNAGTGIEMELAKDALKDFSYSWVRMRLQSVGPDKENMKLELSLDGRPNRALYYSFDENTASFIKSTTPCLFQGIRLDTNVNMYGKAMELVDYFQRIFNKAE